MPKQSTSYKGLTVNENEKNQLINQPIGNFLRYEKEGDNFIIQQKLPKVGTYEGKDFNPQRAMNAFTKGLGSLFTDKNKVLNISEFNNKSSIITELFTEIDDNSQYGGFYKADVYEKSIDDLMKELKVPSSERENTKTFIKAIGPYARQTFSLLSDEVEKLNKYHSIVSKYNDFPENKKQMYKDFINENKNDVINLQNRLFSFKDIDIKNNEKLIYSSDCITSSKITNVIVNSYNNYCDSHKGFEDKKITGDIQDLDLHAVEHNKDTEDLKFYDHHLYSADVKLDNKDFKLTLETTAPSANELLHEPGDHKTGLGLYDSNDEILNHYKETNVFTKTYGYPSEIINSFGNNDMVNVLNPIVDKKELESMKPKEPNGFFKFCHEYLHLFNNMFNEYNAQLAKYEEIKNYQETVSQFSNDGQDLNNAFREKVSINDPSVNPEMQKEAGNDSPSLNNNKDLNIGSKENPSLE